MQLKMTITDYGPEDAPLHEKDWQAVVVETLPPAEEFVHNCSIEVVYSEEYEILRSLDKVSDNNSHFEALTRHLIEEGFKQGIQYANSQK